MGFDGDVGSSVGVWAELSDAPEYVITATPRKATIIAVRVNDDSRVLRRRREKPYVQNVAVAYSVVRSVVLGQ